MCVAHHLTLLSLPPPSLCASSPPLLPSVSTSTYAYTFRVNSSDTPLTLQKLDPLVADFDRGKFYKYVDAGVVTVQVRTVGRTWSEEEGEIEGMKRLLTLLILSSCLPPPACVPLPVHQLLIDRYILRTTTTPNGTNAELLSDVTFAPLPIPAHQQDNFAGRLVRGGETEGEGERGGCHKQKENHMEVPLAQQFSFPLFVLPCFSLCSQSNIVGLFLVCAFMWPFSRLVRGMVEEKEKRIRQGSGREGRNEERGSHE